MLRENDAIRKLLHVDVWHKAGYTGKNMVGVILDGANGKPGKNMFYYTDVFGKATKSGHATNVAQTIHEIAPDSKILYFDNTHNKDAVFEWVKTHKDEIDFINVSLAGLCGMTTDDYLRYEALEIPMICASGNDGYKDHISYPARYPFTIAIGATNIAGDYVDSYSNGGPMLNAVCVSHIAIVNDEGEVWRPSGTSYASPTAKGLLFIYGDWRKVNGLPKLTTTETFKFVESNCIDIEDKGRDYASGYGLFCLPEEIPVLNPVTPSPVVPEQIKEKEITTMPKIYISPSSQESNQGVGPFSTEEAEMNKIADYLIPLLSKDGRFETKRNSPSMDPYQMAADSNSFGAGIHVAIHSNAGGGEGTEVYAYAPNTNSDKLAKFLYGQIAPLSPGADRGVKYNPKLIEVGDSVKATSCLIELAFHDNLEDATWMDYFGIAIAEALYKGICDFYKYDYKALDVAPVVDAPVTPDKDIYLSVRVLQSKADQAIKDINKLGFAAKVMDLA